MFVVPIGSNLWAAAELDKAVLAGGGRATFQIYDEDDMSSDDNEGFATQQSIKALHDNARFGTGVIGEDEISNTLRYYQIPLLSFCVHHDDPYEATPVGMAVDNDTGVGYKFDGNLPCIFWPDGGTSPIMVNIRMPQNYASGFGVQVLCTETDSTTPNRVDFDLVVNRYLFTGGANEATPTNQVPIALNGYTGTPDEVTLTPLPATEFAAGSGLASGDWVRLRLWPDDVTDGTGDLHIKGVAWYCWETM
jgi:hypothetical protein